MIIDISRRLINPKARQWLLRNRHLKAKELKLDDSEYRLLDLYGAVSGWDKRYEHIFEAVHATDKQIGDILRWSSSKTCRVRNKLIKKGLVEEIDIGAYKILFHFHKDENLILQSQVANLQTETAEAKEEIADLQPVRGQNINTSLYSSNKVYVALHTRDEYIRVIKIVEDVTKQINDAKGWFSDDPEMKKLVEEQQQQANAMLMYEIENDLLPI